MYIQYSVERFKKRGLKYNPDLIIWFLKDDDLGQIQDLLIVEVDQLTKLGHKTFDETTRDWVAYRMATENITKKYSEERILQMQKENILSIRKYYTGKILFLTHIQIQKYLSLVKDMIEEDKNISLLELSGLNNDELKYIDSHLNEKGNEFLAEKVFSFFKTQKIIPCE